MSLWFRSSWLVISLVCAPALAQSSSEFDQWKQQTLSEFDAYKDELDRQFAEFLKSEWKGFETREGVRRDPVPKPVDIPRDKPRKLAVPKPVQPKTIEPPPEIAVETPGFEPSRKQGERVEMVFLGHEIVLYSRIGRDFLPVATIDQAGLQRGFAALAQSDYEILVVDLLKIRTTYRLNDWAYLQLVLQFSNSYLPDADNAARLLSWFLLLKSDLKARIAYANNEIFLLIPAMQPLFDVEYFLFEDEWFYVVSRHQSVPKRLVSYDGRYPKNLSLPDMTGIDAIVLASKLGYRDISFAYGGTDFSLRVPFNQHAVDFFNTYPQMDIEYYFDVTITGETREALISQLGPLVAQLSTGEAVNFLLRLVQTGFDYKTDGQQFGRENYLFLEETIFYPSSDCEDRSVLFAWLVQQLLEIDVVGLKYPGHIATAVLLDEPTGEFVIHGGKRFTIADPTYINASAGRQMPKFENIQPTVIPYRK